MKKALLPVLAGTLISLAAGLANAAPASAAPAGAEATPLYGIFQHAPTGYVFVKLPSGFVFAGRDDALASRSVLRHATSGFVFVQLADGWKFVGRDA
jgi:hypothetical protein